MYWLDKGTNFHIVKLDRIEADDIMAMGCRIFKDKEVILSTYDQDLEQCWAFSNVKIWSIMKKFKGGKGAYKIPKKNFNPYQLISKKIEKEVSDNLVNPILNQEDYEKRELCVNLLSLPDFIENPIKERLLNLKKEEVADLNCIPFQKLREEIGDLYNNKSKLITYEMCVAKEEKKRRKKKCLQKKS